MAERASMPTFVPRTVASFERAATAVARRVAAPVRTLAARALSFADRLVGTWAVGPTVPGLDGGARPAMRAAVRGGGMPLPRPWYEVDKAEDAIWPQQAARAAATVPASATGATAAAAALPSAAERGAAIARTALTAPPELVARAAAAAEQAARGATGELPAATAAAATAAADVRVAEALGLRTSSPPVAPMVAAPAARAATPLARALRHAAWVDAQLHVVAAPLEPAARATGGLVFVAPADVERPAARESAARESAARESAARESAPSRADGEAVVRAAAAQPAAAVVTTALPVIAAAPALAAWSAVLPDPRLPATMPTAIAQRVAEFVARLVGVQSARDAAPLAAAELPAVATAMPPAAGATAAGAIERTAARAAGVERTYVVLAPPAPVTASWRPGAAGARVEQLSARIDGRAMVAWGEPATMATMATGGEAARGARSTGAAATTVGEREVPAIERTFVAPDAAPVRATGAARLSQFVQQLVGVQAARATAPLPVPSLVAAAARSVEAAAPGVTAAASLRAPERVNLTATTSAAIGDARARTVPQAATAPGAIARRAEQLGGAVGVRAASLSIDFVDPSRLSLLGGGAPAMPTVAPAEAKPAAVSDTIMPAPRPLFATPASAPPALTAEEWSLVATFPSAATAVQLAAARQSSLWTAERTMLSAVAAGAATAAARASARGSAGGERADSVRAARGGAPTEYVAPTVAPSESEARLPGGRMPRGSFTWPRLADASLARAEWTAPAAVTVAEQAKRAAPGTPLWGALPPLVAVSPSLAASTSAVAAAAASAPPAREPVRGETAAPGATEPRGAVVREAARTETRGDAPAMTLMTAAATREARTAARMGTRDGAAADGGASVDARQAPAMPIAAATGEPARATASVSNVRPPAAMPLMTAAPAGARDGAGAPTGPAARALELARPFLRLVESGIAGGGEPGARGAAGPRFYEQPQPLVAGAPSSESASRIVEALRSQPATPSSDDRVSLADLTLIAIASATQQVAASPAGGGPGGGGASAAPSSSSSPDAASHGGGGHAANPEQQIEQLARETFAELQRLYALALERSGHHG